MAVKAASPSLSRVSDIPLEVLVKLVHDPDSYDDLIAGIARERANLEEVRVKAEAAEKAARAEQDKAHEALRDVDAARVQMEKDRKKHDETMQIQRDELQQVRSEANDTLARAKALEAAAAEATNRLADKIRNADAREEAARKEIQDAEKARQDAEGEKEAYRKRRADLEGRLAELKERLEGFTL